VKKKEVVILAGGLGTRLSKVLGASRPKPMALIDSKPLLEHQILLCKKYGFTKILILVHHLSETIEEYFGDGSNLGVDIEFHKERSPRGTAGAIKDSIDLLEDDFLIIYGDIFLDVNLDNFFKEFKSSKSDILAFTHPNSHPYDSDLFHVDKTNKILKIFRPKKGEIYSNLVNAALYASTKEIFTKNVENHGIIDIAKDLYPLLIEENKKLLTSYKSVEYIKDMGTPERYAAVQEDLKSGCIENLSPDNKRKAIFLDRDGVINKEVGYIKDTKDFELIDSTAEAIRIINKSGYLAICITNQPVIARGDLSFEGLKEIHCLMETKLGEKGAYLDDIFFCPHHPDSGFEGEIKELKINCECRKPSPGMINEASLKYNIDTNQSWVIGDHERDMQAGKNANTHTVFISTSEQELYKNYDFKADTLLTAVNYIFKK